MPCALEVPLSILKMVTNYFRFQQAGHCEMRTIKFIVKLPAQVLPTIVDRDPLIFGPGLSTIVDRNPLIFGLGRSTDYCVHVAVSFQFGVLCIVAYRALLLSSVLIFMHLSPISEPTQHYIQYVQVLYALCSALWPPR